MGEAIESVLAESILPLGVSAVSSFTLGISFSINGSVVTLLSRQEKVLKLSVPQQYPSMVYKIMYKKQDWFCRP